LRYAFLIPVQVSVLDTPSTSYNDLAPLERDIASCRLTGRDHYCLYSDLYPFAESKVYLS
jgi:hypothetical protein